MESEGINEVEALRREIGPCRSYSTLRGQDEKMSNEDEALSAPINKYSVSQGPSLPCLCGLTRSWN